MLSQRFHVRSVRVNHVTTSSARTLLTRLRSIRRCIPSITILNGPVNCRSNIQVRTEPRKHYTTTGIARKARAKLPSSRLRIAAAVQEICRHKVPLILCVINTATTTASSSSSTASRPSLTWRYIKVTLYSLHYLISCRIIRLHVNDIAKQAHACSICCGPVLSVESRVCGVCERIRNGGFQQLIKSYIKYDAAHTW
jgi:hypothetical protein